MKEFEKEISQQLISKIISCFYKVYNDLGYGFLERVYQNALYYSLIDANIKCEIEKPIKVYHNERVVGDFKADWLLKIV